MNHSPKVCKSKQVKKLNRAYTSEESGADSTELIIGIISEHGQHEWTEII